MLDIFSDFKMLHCNFTDFKEIHYNLYVYRFQDASLCFNLFLNV